MQNCCVLKVFIFNVDFCYFKVFVRELISNASDALEKLRYIRLSDSEAAETAGDRNLEIHIATDKQSRTLTIQDTGVGMTREELISHLGTIARSGSKVSTSSLYTLDFYLCIHSCIFFY